MHYCINCGSQLDDDVYKCPYCGYHNENKKQEKNNSKVKEEDHVNNGWAIAGFVLSLTIPVLGIIFSAIGLGQLNKYKKGYKRLAGAGLTIGILFSLISVLGVILA